MKNWNQSLLGELFDIQIGKTPFRDNPIYWGEGNSWLSIADMKTEQLSKTKESITDLAIKECNMKQIPKNTVVMSFKLSIGKIGVTTSPMYTNEAIAGFLPKTNLIDNNYLKHALKKINYSGKIDRAAMGATLNKKKLQELTINYPEIQEQKRIADILDRIQKNIILEEKKIVLFDKLLLSTFNTWFTKCQSEFSHSNVQDLTVTIRGGGTPRKSIPEYYDSASIPWITPKDMKKDFLSDSAIRINELGLESSSANLMPKGSLLLVQRSGILKHTLPVAIATSEVTTNQDLKSFVFDTEKVTPEYMMYFFKSSQDALLGKVRAVTADNLNLKDILNLIVYVPPIEKQNKFSELVYEVKEIKERTQLKVDKQNELFQACLQRAFLGEL